MRQFANALIPDPAAYITGPSTLGLLEQRNKIIAHLKNEGTAVPKHLLSASNAHLSLSHQQPSVHLTYLLMWVAQQGIVLPPDLCKTRKHNYRFTSLESMQPLISPMSYKDLPAEILPMINAYNPSDEPVELFPRVREQLDTQHHWSRIKLSMNLQEEVDWVWWKIL